MGIKCTILVGGFVCLLILIKKPSVNFSLPQSNTNKVNKLTGIALSSGIDSVVNVPTRQVVVTFGRRAPQLVLSLIFHHI